MEIKKVVKKWEIWDDKEKVARLEEKLKKLVLEQFYKLIKVFEKIVSEKMLMRKMWDHMIDLEEGFVPRKVIPCLQKRERVPVLEYQDNRKCWLTRKRAENKLWLNEDQRLVLETGNIC